MPTLQDEFRAACSTKVEIDSETADLAQQVLERCHNTILETSTFGYGQPAQDEVAKRHCFAAVLYLAKTFVERGASPGTLQTRSSVSLSRILSAFDVGLEEFLKELPTVIRRAEPNLTALLGESVPLARLLRLRELQTSFVYSTVLAKKTKDLFRSYFDVSISGQGTTDKSSPFCAAWLLFVTAKSKLLPAFPDLVASFNLLICVLNVAIMHIPATHRNVDLHDHSLFPVRTESGTDTLQSLCLVNKANLPAVRALMHGMDNLLTDAAKAVPPTTTNGLNQAPSDMTTSCTFHPGFMSDPAVTAAVAESLDTEYQQACVKSIDVDERPFLGRAIEAPPTPGPSAAPPSLAKCLVGSPQRTPSSQSRMVYLSPVPKDQSSAPLHTPSPSGRNPISIFGLAQTPGMPGMLSRFPGTPVSDAMTAASWLHDMSLRHPQQPTQQLQRFFKACDYDMTDLVAARIEQMAQAVFPLVPSSEHALQALQAAMNNERRQQGVKLYYNVLEAMLTAEETRTQRTNFTSLLSSNSFHKCIAACAFELIVASYKMATHAFPAVLEKLELHAFDMCKIIDPFVRYEPSAPRDLKRHLHSIEEKILESLAWERGSSLYPLLVMAAEHPETRPLPAAEDAGASGSPGHADKPSHSQPNTPTKRKSSSGDSMPASPNKVHKGNGDSSPSHDKANKPTASEQPDSTMTAEDGDKAGLAATGVAPPAEPADKSAAASTPQRLSPAQEGPLQTPQRMASASAFSVFMSPLVRGSGAKASAGYHQPAGVALPTGFGPMDSTVSASDKSGRHILQDFLRKVLRLAANRLHDLCGRLDLQDASREDIETQVYHLVQHVIFQHTFLLYNRHLDQIMLSAIYGVCKVAQLKQISFKQIINHYRRQPQAKSDIFRTVVLKQSEPELQVLQTGDVIAFYNSVFVPAVKTDLLRINQDRASLPAPPAAEGLIGESPVRRYNRPEFPPNGFSTPPPASRALHGLSQRPNLHKVSASKKVFVSPLRQSSPKQATTMTPRTRSLYAYVGESHQPYQSPSKDLDMINGRISGRLPHVMGVQGASHNSGSSGHSSMEASQSPSVSNSAGALMRQSSTVSGGEPKTGSGALQVLQAAAARAEKWKADAAEGAAGVSSHQADDGSDSQGTRASSHAARSREQSGKQA